MLADQVDKGNKLLGFCVPDAHINNVSGNKNEQVESATAQAKL